MSETKDVDTMAISIDQTKRLVGKLTAKDREIFALKMDLEELERERTVIIEKLKHTILPRDIL